MNETSKSKHGWRIMRRLLIGVAILATLIAIFYTEEDWRGKRAWENCKRELEAKGVALDWDKYIPPSVPDDQNFFKAPKMAEWFVKNPNSTSDLTKRLANPRTSAIGTTNAIVSEREARDYLTWSDQFRPDFNLMRAALERPYARMDGDYSKPYQQPIPNFVAVRIVAQTLAQRAHCHLLLNQPELALDDLTLLHDMCRLLEAAPTGRPMTLVAAMINVAVTGLYVDTLAEGIRLHGWQEPQLTALKKQLAEINVTPFVFDALQEEPASLCRTAEINWIPKLFDMSGHTKWTTRVVWWFWPRGWIYQNMVNVAVLGQKPLDGFDLGHDTVAPRKFEEVSREVDQFFSDGKWPYKLLAAIGIPNYSKAEQTTAHNQTMVNEAQISCALERYRLADGEYPETLDALVPQFMEKLPHDIIGGQPLHYRRTPDGKFLLYSIGWNETDDGGVPSPRAQNGGTDFTQGDWVWPN